MYLHYMASLRIVITCASCIYFRLFEARRTTKSLPINHSPEVTCGVQKVTEPYPVTFYTSARVALKN